MPPSTISKSISNEWVGRGGIAIWQYYEYALRHIGRRETLLDAGCGCGVLGIMAAIQGYAAKIVMCDLDKQALVFAKRNCEMYGVDAEIIEADLCDLEGAFDLVIGNLPRNIEPEKGLNPLRFTYPNGVMFELLRARMSAILKPHGFMIINDNCTVRTFPGLKDTLLPRNGDFKTVQGDVVSTTGFITGLPVMPMFEADQCVRIVEYLG